MTRVLVLGAAGMLGHKVLQRLGAGIEAAGAVRKEDPQIEELASLTGATIHAGMDATNFSTVARVMAVASPDVIVNCVGVIKQREGRTQREEMVRVNALFPHELAHACQASGARLIHLSTDCVFSGKRGMYGEADDADPVDAYGMSKLLGEPLADDALTIRTSMIGRELRGFHSLLEWFLRQRGEVRGFVHAIFSGLTNIALADEISRIIRDLPELRGLHHVAAEPIAKYDLLHRLADAYGMDVHVNADDGPRCDRSLSAARYRELTGFTPPSWDQMIREMAADPTPYADLQGLAQLS